MSGTSLAACAFTVYERLAKTHFERTEVQMSTITTRKEQRDTASAARKVGGYSALVRLAAEKSKQGKDSTIRRDEKSGRWTVVKAAKR